MQLQGDMMFVKALLHRKPKVSISTTESNHQFSQTNWTDIIIGSTSTCTAPSAESHQETDAQRLELI